MQKRLLRRKLKGSPFRKNMVACISPMLKLMCSLIDEQRTYEERPAERTMIRRLEAKLEPDKKPKPKRRRSVQHLGCSRPGKRRRAA